MSAQKLDITRLGGQGDGIAETREGQIFVPFTVPGDVINAGVEKSRASLIAVLTPSPDRVTPPCPHFGPDEENAGCGGCALQHVADEAYRDWKRGLVVVALESRNIAADVAPLVSCEPHARRRVVFAARRTEKGAILGFNRAQSHHIVHVETCVVASERINQALPALRRLATAVAVGKEPFRLSVLDAAPGLDLAADAPFKLAEPDRLRIIQAVRADAGIARLTFNGEILIEKQPPELEFGRVTVNPPPGGFVQASKAAEEVMGDLVTGHLKKSKRVADLFSGAGTFALRLRRDQPRACGGSRRGFTCRTRQGRTADTGAEARHGGKARPIPPPADGFGTEDLPRAGVRSAARRRRGAGSRHRPLHHPPHRRRLLQPGNTGARSRDPDQGRLPAYLGDADRPVPMVCPCRGGGALGAAEAVGEDDHDRSSPHQQNLRLSSAKIAILYPLPQGRGQIAELASPSPRPWWERKQFQHLSVS